MQFHVLYYYQPFHDDISLAIVKNINSISQKVTLSTYATEKVILIYLIFYRQSEVVKYLYVCVHVRVFTEPTQLTSVHSLCSSIHKMQWSIAHARIIAPFYRCNFIPYRQPKRLFRFFNNIFQQHLLSENFEAICLSRKISLPFRSISSEKFIYTPIDSRSSFGSI